MQDFMDAGREILGWMGNHPEVSVKLALFTVVGGVVIYNLYQYLETTRRPDLSCKPKQKKPSP